MHDADLQVLEHFRQMGTVTNWLDRRTDLYLVRWHGNNIEESPA